MEKNIEYYKKRRSNPANIIRDRQTFRRWRAKHIKAQRKRELDRYYKEKSDPIKLEQRLKKARIYYLTRKLKEKARKAVYYKDNKASIKKRVKKYRKINPHVRRICNSNRRARTMSTSDGTINVHSVNEMLIAQGRKCKLCPKDISEKKNRHLDHIVPLSKGGEHSIKNVQWLCPECNYKKADNIL